jgi:small-conductance mechanosensitive channel
MTILASVVEWVGANISFKILFWDIIRIVAIYIVARVINKLSDKLVTRMLAAKYQGPIKFDPRRANTIGRLIHNLVSYTVNFISVMLILGLLGINLGPLLASAGVLGLAIGFGAQSLVKDVITGFFIIFEDQFGVGDVIQIEQVKGTVEEIGIRVTRVKSWTGEVHIIPNGNIKQVTNFSVYNSLAIVDISIPYESDMDKAIEVLKEAVVTIYEDSEMIVKQPEVQGVQMITNSEIKLRIIAECKPNTQGDVVRLMNAAIKKRLDEHGIEAAHPKTVTYLRTERAAE